LEYLNPEELEITHGVQEKKRFEELLTSIRAEGILETIKYVEYNGLRYIVNGHHRHKIAMALQMKTVPVEQVYLPYNGYNTEDDLIYQDIR